ncbi:FecR family protein [Methylomicrobium sp. Wu6]|uniref:FecR family protein n=1 Tax=Methylomicrobium sp. Wu6 TaxID=3107928 RepID=UPI002DD621AA|nr:FecR family protein [Methylomicrobium sp. Wu6]MEC4748518.1 FecR family protein [Methylomicrobium sp. Wu6]
MNSLPDPAPESAAVLDEALTWFARLQDSKAGPEVRRAFAAWRDACPEHAEAYAQVIELWQAPALDAALAHYAVIPLPVRRTPLRLWAAAACLLLTMGWGLHAGGLLDRWRADYVTVAGEQRRIMLADGSAVTLNTDTALVSDFDGERRGIRILHGEAYFEVKPDSARPFIVTAEAATVRVVGTRFTVRAGGDTLVAVESGIVACAAGTGATLRLTADQQAAISAHGVEKRSDADNGPAFAWLQGRLIFQDRPLAEVIAELDRYHPGIIYLAGGKLAVTRITGNYKLGDTGAVIRSLANITGAQVMHLSPYLTVLKM